MSEGFNSLNIGGSGNFSNFEDLLKTLNDVSKRLPAGVRFKRERNRYLNFQITMPDGKRKVKPSGCDLTDVGIYQALDKAHKIRHALNTIKSETELWEWYDREILGINEIKSDLTTYREIFEKIETKYWNGRNKNTKRKRSKDIPNDVATYERQYCHIFERFSDWDKQPEWSDIKTVLFTWQQGTKSFKDAYTVIKQICLLCPNSDKLLGLLSDIDYKQTEFKERQSISLEAFLNWHTECLNNATERYRESRESWLWVASMCVVYGLRPSEIAAAQNLTKPYSKEGITIPALNNPNNKDLLLVLGDKTYFGTTIKTGSRVCRPMATDKKLIERLNIQRPKLPEYKPNKNSKPEAICKGFYKTFAANLTRWKLPITQTYAFRHLSNQLGEKYGIPQEIRARSLGHSVAVNDSVYKKRSNFATSVDLLTNHSKQPLSLEMAIHQLEIVGFDLDDPSVKAVLKVIYQLD